MSHGQRYLIDMSSSATGKEEIDDDDDDDEAAIVAEAFRFAEVSAFCAIFHLQSVEVGD